MKYKDCDKKRLYIRLRDISLRNAQFDPVRFPIEKSAKFDDGMTVVFRLKSSGNPENPKEYTESVAWKPAGEPEYVQEEAPNKDHKCFWRWMRDETSYELIVEILPVVCDNLPDGFHAKLTTNHMKTRFYIRDNNGWGYLKYQPPDVHRQYPVMFDEMSLAYVYLEHAVENPNLYSVVNFIESDPVQMAWLIRKV